MYILCTIIQNIMTLIIIMLLSYDKYPYELLPCLYYVMFLSFDFYLSDSSELYSSEHIMFCSKIDCSVCGVNFCFYTNYDIIF